MGHRGPERYPRPSAQAGHQHPLVTLFPKVVHHRGDLVDAVRVIRPAGGMAEVRALAPAREVQPDGRVAARRQSPGVVDPCPARPDVGLRTGVAPHDRRPTRPFGVGLDADEALASQPDDPFGHPIDPSRPGIVRRLLDGGPCRRGPAHPVADRLHHRVRHIGVLRRPVESDVGAGWGSMVGRGPEGPQSRQQRVAGLAVVAVDDQHLGCGAFLELRDVDGPQPFEGIGAQDTAGVCDAAPDHVDVVGDRLREELQLADIGPPALHRRPRHDPVSSHRGALE